MNKKKWKIILTELLNIGVCMVLIAAPLLVYLFQNFEITAVAKTVPKEHCMEYEVVTVAVNDPIGGGPIDSDTSNFLVNEVHVLVLDERASFFESETGYRISNIPIESEKTTTWTEVEEIVYETVCDMKYLDPATAYAFMKVESSFQSDAYSCADCVGLLQLFPKYQIERMEKVGATNLFIPEDNIKTGCSLLNDLLRDYDLELAVKVYGWGADNADKEQYQEAMQVYIDKVYLYQDEWNRLYADNYDEFLESRNQ